MIIERGEQLSFVCAVQNSGITEYDLKENKTCSNPIDLNSRRFRRKIEDKLNLRTIMRLENKYKVEDNRGKNNKEIAI